MYTEIFEILMVFLMLFLVINHYMYGGRGEWYGCVQYLCAHYMSCYSWWGPSRRCVEWWGFAFFGWCDCFYYCCCCCCCSGWDWCWEVVVVFESMSSCKNLSPFVGEWFWFTLDWFTLIWFGFCAFLWMEKCSVGVTISIPFYIHVTRGLTWIFWLCLRSLCFDFDPRQTARPHCHVYQSWLPHHPGPCSPIVPCQ